MCAIVSKTIPCFTPTKLVPAEPLFSVTRNPSVFELVPSRARCASSGDGRHRKGMPTAPPHPRAAAARARAAAQRLRERRFSVVPASDRVLMLHFPVLAGLPSRPSRATMCRPRENIMFAGSHNELERCAALLLPQKPGESWFRRCSR